MGVCPLLVLSIWREINKITTLVHGKAGKIIMVFPLAR
jgi:hypothetical protein